MQVSQRFPEWLRRPWGGGGRFDSTREVLGGLGLNTVCQSARCPNQGECWARGTAAVMVLGNTCTRNCSFCSVASGRPGSMDADEPERVAEAVGAMKLKHAVVTTVVRDDLDDGGAAHIAETIRAIHRVNAGTSVEVLVSDFGGVGNALDTVLDAEPEVFAHNIETVRRLQGVVRDRRFGYDRSLETLRTARDHAGRHIVKSGLMVGHGETAGEVASTLEDLVSAGCEAVCVGQYLRPGKRQREVAEFVRPEQFEAYEKLAVSLGFKFAFSGPFVRSSYRSEEVLGAAARFPAVALPPRGQS